MTYIFLPGQSERNIEPAQNLQKRFTAEGKQIYVHQWMHWLEEVNFNLKAELESLRAELKGIENYVIIAKSIGTRVALHLVCELNTKPKKLVLMGLPLKQSGDKNKQFYNSTLKEFEGEIIVIQNENDPMGSADDIRKVLAGVEYKEIVKDASDHSYDYPDEIFNFATN